jgi:hypothetical protein
MDPLIPGMTSDRTSPVDPAREPGWSAPDGRPRLIVDAAGVEWEVYDESAWTLELALDWEFLPQTENPGLIFSAPSDRRRLWPCPRGWRELSDAQLLAHLEGARSLY